MKEVSVSFLKEGSYEEYIKEINNTNADYIHFDVMDGKFVERKNLKIKELKNLLSISKKKNDVHLMVKKPNKYIRSLKKYNTDYITVHFEIKNLDKTITKIKKQNKKVGIAINPETNIEKIYPYLNKIDLVLIMGVHPGKSGQKYLKETTDKINKLKEEIKNKKLNTKIEIDGGINEETLNEVVNADIVVSASYILNDFSNIDKIKKVA